VGKYLSSRALLKYEQSLAERSSFLLNLEYFLSRHLKLETLLGQQTPSGVEFTWTDDY
jgi:autotransporter translocation and assembly factor TamB